eukprot:TRINITY_DN48990_c0_g1_i1.p1 TRINITY_DN48990_c0_g1~~TRINITY_DN48990_c0_g1_i1.p1  ORF type:complete len:152 (+),score=35.37 TRINITY_DN48990_c0_g1_i1:80-535(+)
MVWLPDHIWAQQKGNGKKGFVGGGATVGKSKWKPSDASGWSTGFNKGSKAKGKGSKGKGKRKSSPPMFDANLKVWVGNVPENLSWKELQEHMNKAGTVKWCEIFGGNNVGSAMVAYATAEEAAHAIMVMNNSVIGSGTIMCDAWAKQSEAS